MMIGKVADCHRYILKIRSRLYYIIIPNLFLIQKTYSFNFCDLNFECYVKQYRIMSYNLPVSFRTIRIFDDSDDDSTNTISNLDYNVLLIVFITLSPSMFYSF